MEDAIQSKNGEEIVDVTIEESWFLNGFSRDSAGFCADETG